MWSWSYFFANFDPNLVLPGLYWGVYGCLFLIGIGLAANFFRVHFPVKIESTAKFLLFFVFVIALVRYGYRAIGELAVFMSITTCVIAIFLGLYWKVRRNTDPKPYLMFALKAGLLGLAFGLLLGGAESLATVGRYILMVLFSWGLAWWFGLVWFGFKAIKGRIQTGTAGSRNFWLMTLFALILAYTYFG